MSTFQDVVRLFSEGQIQALADILAERSRQDDKWGVQNHRPLEWLGIIMEEVGEFSKEAIDAAFTFRKPDPNLRVELVQVAACVLATIECCDREGWVKG